MFKHVIPRDGKQMFTWEYFSTLCLNCSFDGSMGRSLHCRQSAEINNAVKPEHSFHHYLSRRKNYISYITSYSIFNLQTRKLQRSWKFEIRFLSDMTQYESSLLDYLNLKTTIWNDRYAADGLMFKCTCSEMHIDVLKTIFIQIYLLCGIYQRVYSLQIV